MRVIIVGAGLFGCVAARACLQAGHAVTIIDAKKPEAASPAAACLMKPSWMQGLGANAELGLEFLHKLYVVETLKFQVRIGTHASSMKVVEQDVFWINPRDVLDLDVVYDNVTSVNNGKVTTDRAFYEGQVYVAAGIWCEHLVAGVPPQKALTGAAVIYDTPLVPPPRITPYAPYKQAVSFGWKPGETWFGDGSAILRKNWTDERRAKTAERARLWHGLPISSVKRQIVGQRPYTGRPEGFFQQVDQHTWVGTGGAKNGMVLAGYFAKRFVEAIS